jgi:hypothetical protein
MNVDLVEQFNFIIVYMHVPPVVKHVHIKSFKYKLKNYTNTNV